jgi:AraC-like DNA-binding protein
MRKTISVLAFQPTAPGVPRISTTCLTKGQGAIGPHAHEFFEMIYVEEGEMRHWLGNEQIVTRPGDLFLIPPNEVHEINVCGECRVWVVAFEVGVLTQDLAASNTFLTSSDNVLLSSFLVKGNGIRKYAVQAPHQRLRWVERLQSMAGELQEQHVGFAEVLRATLILMLIEATRLAPEEPDTCLLRVQPMLTSVLRFISENYKSQISLSDVATSLSRSPAYLTDYVRRETGRTVLCWIVEYRMAEARRLLLTTSYSVQQISEEVGYMSTGHFNRQFRKLHNLPPQTWRQSYWSTNQ